MYRTRRPLLALMAAGVIATMSILPAATASAALEFPRVDVTAGWTTHVQNIGNRSQSQHTDLVGGGNVLNFTLGTQGQSLRLEYVEASPVRINSNISTVIRSNYCGINLQGHVQNIGWQGVSSRAGTTGQALRLEAIKMWSTCSNVKIRYSVHVQNIGWMDTKTAGQVAGTTGRGLAIEAVRVSIELPDLRHIHDQIWNYECLLAGTC